jgi:hypothetical protein
VQKYNYFDVMGDELVENVKSLIHNKRGIPVDLQRLVYAGKQLQDQKELMEYGIQNGSTLHLSLQIRGGMTLWVKTPLGEILASVPGSLPYACAIFTYDLWTPKEWQKTRLMNMRG